MDNGQLAHDIQQVIFDTAKILLYPVLVTAIGCLVWMLIELGVFLYEVYLRVRYRNLETLESSTLRAREAFLAGRPRKAYRLLQENTYSVVVVRFLYDLIRNYQTRRLAVKPLKLLQEYEFYTVKRLERTRILVRVGPMLGLMGTLIPLAPALEGLAKGNTQQLSDNLRIAFSVTVIGLLIGGLAFMISVFRDRFYSQDISDLEYLLELLEGSDERLKTGRPRQRQVRPEEVAGAEVAGETPAAGPAGGITAARPEAAPTGEMTAETAVAAQVDEVTQVLNLGLESSAAPHEDTTAAPNLERADETTSAALDFDAET